MDGLELAAHDLRAIADGLDSLAGVPGVLLDHVSVHGYRVTVQHRDSQLDGASYVVTGHRAGAAVIRRLPYEVLPRQWAAWRAEARRGPVSGRPAGRDDRSRP